MVTFACPHCKNRIPVDSEKCDHCGNNFEISDLQRSENEQKDADYTKYKTMMSNWAMLELIATPLNAIIAGVASFLGLVSVIRMLNNKRKK